MTSRNLRLALLLSSSLGVAVIAGACGGISDPTKGGSGRVATVSGALTGVAVPANARVALVYRNVAGSTGSGASVQVASDVPVIDGKFTMNLGTPPDGYFAAVEASAISNATSPPSIAPSPAPISSGTGSAPSTSGSPGAFAASQLAPRDLVGGQITQPLSAAVAGFVVYADTNGNGALDLGGYYAASSDQILGGNKELMLVYLKGGGALDYEKMRDKSGILPSAGFDLAWTEGRWLPLTEVELKLTANALLPSSVCESGFVGASGRGTASTDPISSDSSGADGATAVVTTDGGEVVSTNDGGTSGGFPNNYPSPSDPNLHCSPDGRSYTYGGGPSDCPPSPPPPTGLCAGGDAVASIDCAGVSAYGNALAAGAPVPDGWPCVTVRDGGSFDAGSGDGGSFDGGSPDAAL